MTVPKARRKSVVLLKSSSNFVELNRTPIEPNKVSQIWEKAKMPRGYFFHHPRMDLELFLSPVNVTINNVSKGTTQKMLYPQFLTWVQAIERMS